jgi:hypothetical protein
VDQAGGRNFDILIYKDANKMALNDNSFKSDRAADSQVVIGLFSNGNDAQQAIGELREQGFRTNQIGAAFRETAAGSEFDSPQRNRSQIGDEIRDVTVGHNLTERSYSGSSSLDAGSAGGPASGSNAVTPAGLCTGSGTGLSGAGRPGPIPGSDIPRSLSRNETDDRNAASYGEPGREWPESTRSNRAIDIAPGGSGPDVTTLSNSTPTATYTEAERLNKASHANESWWEKLKNFFTDDDSADTHVSSKKEKSETKFGTGEGDLGLTSEKPMSAVDTDEHDFAYSAAEFEGSLTSLGLDQRQARAFARELGAQGAIVTVAAGDRLSTAEEILERNNGRIRYEQDAAYDDGGLENPLSSTQGSYNPNERIQLFGEVRRAYRQRAIPTYEEREITRRDDLKRPA